MSCLMELTLEESSLACARSDKAPALQDLYSAISCHYLHTFLVPGYLPSVIPVHLMCSLLQVITVKNVKCLIKMIIIMK